MTRYGGPKINKKRNINGEEAGKKKKWADHELQHPEIKVSSERKRRDMFIKLYAALHALLPHLPPKADKATIVDTAITSIKYLEESLENLEKKRVERLINGASKSNNVVSSGNINKQAQEEEEDQQPLVLSAGNQTTINNKLEKRHRHRHDHEVSGYSTSDMMPSPRIVFETYALSNVTMNVCGPSVLINICSLKKPGLLTTICFILEKYNLHLLSASVNTNHLNTTIMIHLNDHIVDGEFVEGFRYQRLYKKVVDEIMLNVNSGIQE